MRPAAIGYLRSDISGVSKVWDGIQLRTLAERLGYRLIKTIEFSQYTADPVAQLLTAISKNGVDAVVVPSSQHFGGDIPEAVTSAADVITVSPESTYARRLPSVFDPAPTRAGDPNGHSHSGVRAGGSCGSGLADLRRGLPPMT